MEPTGNSVQSRSSYLPNEILWGHHYESMVSYSKKRGTYVVDCSNLNAVVSNNTPRVSRRLLEDQQAVMALNKAKNSKSSAVGNNTHATPTPAMPNANNVSNNVSNHVSRVQIDSPMNHSTDTIPTSHTPTCSTVNTDVE